MRDHEQPWLRLTTTAIAAIFGVALVSGAAAAEWTSSHHYDTVKPNAWTVVRSPCPANHGAVTGGFTLQRVNGNDFIDEDVQGVHVVKSNFYSARGRVVGWEVRVRSGDLEEEGREGIQIRLKVTVVCARE